MDLAIATLRDAIEHGESEVPPDEKRINRARRSVDKAITILTAVLFVFVNLGIDLLYMVLDPRIRIEA